MNEADNRVNPRKKLDMEKAAEECRRRLLAASETCAKLLADLEETQSGALERTRREREGLFSERERRRREEARAEAARAAKEKEEEEERARLANEEKEREARRARIAKLQAKNASSSGAGPGDGSSSGSDSESDSSDASSSSSGSSDSDSDSDGDKENATRKKGGKVPARMASPVVESKGRWHAGAVVQEPPAPRVKLFQFSALERHKQ